MKPMKFQWVEIDDLGRFVKDDAWVMEQKLDGARCLTHVHGDGTVTFHSGNGGPLTHAASAQHFTKVRAALRPLADAVAESSSTDGIFLDGEMMLDGTYWLFDYLAGEPACSTPFQVRRSHLVNVALGAGLTDGNCVRVLYQARTLDEKMRLAADVERSGGEGVMVKRSNSRYEPGKRVTSSLKIKYVKTADCVVTARNVKGKCNAALAVYENGKLRDVGQMTMIGKEKTRAVSVGDVVEVKFLYATATLTLYQPRMMRVRDDKRPAECTIDQLTPKGVEVIKEMSK